jgi:hypothetical protein
VARLRKFVLPAILIAVAFLFPSINVFLENTVDVNLMYPVIIVAVYVMLALGLNIVVGFARFGPATAVGELNDAAANDIQPNVRKDGREIVFSSNRAGGVGGQDIWSATRASVEDAWSAPVNLGTSVNTSLGESRPSLSWHPEQLLFGRAGPAGTGEGGTGASDIYVTTREKQKG